MSARAIGRRAGEVPSRRSIGPFSSLAHGQGKGGASAAIVGGCREKPFRKTRRTLAEVHLRGALHDALGTDRLRATDEMAVFGIRPYKRSSALARGFPTASSRTSTARVRSSWSSRPRPRAACAGAAPFMSGAASPRRQPLRSRSPWRARAARTALHLRSLRGDEARASARPRAQAPLVLRADGRPQL